jgi:hypothetical protein
MITLQYTLLAMLLAFLAGVPAALLQLYFHRRERKSPMWSAWSGLQKELVNLLHHPHPEAREMDALLEKLQTFTAAGLSEISDTDRARLTSLLRERMDDTAQTQSERLRAEFLLFAMPRVLKEQRDALPKKIL